MFPYGNIGSTPTLVNQQSNFKTGLVGNSTCKMPKQLWEQNKEAVSYLFLSIWLPWQLLSTAEEESHPRRL